MPFEVPGNWCWATIGELFQLQAGKFIEAPQISTCKDATHIYPCYGGNGLRGYVESYNRDGLFPIIGRQGALCGNINIAEGKFYATEHAVVVETFANIDIQLFVYFLIQLNLNQYATATAQPGLAVKTINEVPIPLPPINEQHRISMAIEKSLDTLSEIDQSKHAIRKSILQLKSRILDLAISGKLAAQDCSDEPALELLRRINPSYAPCDNRHYKNLPSGWQEVTFDHIFKSIPTKRFQIQQKEIQSRGATPVISQSANYIEGYTDDRDKIFAATPVIVFGDHTRIVKFVDFPFVVGADGVKIYSTKIFPPYGYYLIAFAAQNIENKGYGRHSQYIAKQRYMLPPYDEQKRIVVAIKAIFMTIDSIVAEL